MMLLDKATKLIGETRRGEFLADHQPCRKLQQTSANTDIFLSIASKHHITEYNRSEVSLLSVA